jgi:hypothetical protein
MHPTLEGSEAMLVDAISRAMWRLPETLSILMRPFARVIETPTPSQPEKQP